MVARIDCRNIQNFFVHRGTAHSFFDVGLVDCFHVVKHATISFMQRDPFKEYFKEAEPDKKHKGYAWSTAIGLQAVDGLKPSEYLIKTAIQNIEGNITIKEAQNLIESYYEERLADASEDIRTEEADKVSARIAEILSEGAFSLNI